MAETPVPAGDYHFEHAGYCEVCEKPALFSAKHRYFRSSLRCPHCNSAPRQLAIWHYLNLFVPQWRRLSVHESSPGLDKMTLRLATECPNYLSSQYDPTVAFGTVVASPRELTKQYRSENLEAQTFEDESFDIVITQDVFEHIFRPDLAIKEIARTLKAGGVYLMTVPIINKQKPSQRRANLSDTGEVIYLQDRSGIPWKSNE